MKTKQKISLAKSAYRAIRLIRSIAGRGDKCVVTRRGIRYELNLSEGIDLAIYLGGSFEADTVRTIARYVRPGQTILDIGANIGALTLELARSAGVEGRVVAFEPTKFAFDKLCRNLALNPELARRVVAMQAFIGSTEDAAAPGTIFSSWPLTGGGDLHATHFGQSKTTEGAATRRLDCVVSDLKIERVDLVKLDVDGYECDVLSGATELLGAQKPIFLIELAPYVHDERGHSFEQFLSFFLREGYRFYAQKSDRVLPSDFRELARLIGDGGSMNVIARAR